MAVRLYPPGLFTALVLSNIQTSIYFRPRLIATRLRSLPQLKGLTIHFSIPLTRPSAERDLWDEEGTPATLPNLKTLAFRGVSAYLEYIVAQIRALVLEWLEITSFNQIAFALPRHEGAMAGARRAGASKVSRILIIGYVIFLVGDSIRP